MLHYRYYHDDVKSAIKKFVCMLRLKLPEGTTLDGKKIKIDNYGIVLFNRDNIKNSYYEIPNDNKDKYGYIFSVTHIGEYKLPDGTKLSMCSYLTEEEVKNTLKYVYQTEIIGGYNIDILYPSVYKVEDGYNWSNVVSELARKGKIRVRNTDHEFRNDSRNITYVNGYSIDGETSVECLGNNSDSSRDIEEHLISLL